mgnify:CR=1 FL=1
MSSAIESKRTKAASKSFFLHFRLQQNMAGINTVTAFFNQLDNVKTKLSFYNL